MIVGHATSDDAAVYRLSDDLALILTTDFFTPIVDRPYDFGAVAAANALSDVYAMAGTPWRRSAWSASRSGACRPRSSPRSSGAPIEKAHEAGIAIVGGHTIQTEEPIFGLAVVGRVDPAPSSPTPGAVPGDVLVLTKPLGLGIITTAAKQGKDGRCDRGGDRRDDNAQPRRVPGASPTPAHMRSPTSRASACSGTCATWPPPAESPPRSGAITCRFCRRPGNMSSKGSRRAAPTQTVASCPTGSPTTPTSPNSSSSCSATRRPREDCWPPCPATKPRRSCDRSMRIGAGSAAVIGSIEAGEPGRIRVRRAPQTVEIQAAKG